MEISYAMVGNRILKDGLKFPRIIKKKAIPVPEVLDNMSKGVGMEPADMRVVLTHFAKAVAHYLGDGRDVETPSGRFGGTFRRAMRLADGNGAAIDASDRRVDRDFIFLKHYLHATISSPRRVPTCRLTRTVNTSSKSNLSRSQTSATPPASRRN